MKLPIRILISLLCAAIIISMPFVLSSPQILDNEKARLMQDDAEEEEAEDEGSEEIDFGRLLFPSAYAEEDEDSQETDGDVIVETFVEGELHINPEWKLPLDFTVPPLPNPDKYTENGYEDQSIRVSVETRVINGITVHITFVRIADASQFRTAVAGTAQNNKTVLFKALARDTHAIAAINGDRYTSDAKKTTFEYRMTEKIRSKTNNLKDILIIDDLGDFHLFIKSQGLHKDDKPYFVNVMKEEGRQVVNAFTFGPALVKDGELLTIDEHYGYNPHGREPRSAIGQTGPLSYVMVLVEGRTSGNDKAGISQQGLAQIMYDLGCVQAYNLDGGNTSEMILCGPADEYGKLTTLLYFEGDQVAGDRQQKDIIYFATAVPESEW
ncbi:MAG: phosphodiester glycosidase family protein [Clostridia bacterium]|jgi:Exopolysaccharide biosynthesis protein related to N-acetylglucosamine-1-phosphodiester alpha-N-acetylglucosaminidase|nr:phosphodiester glycosidase family protein [Clostridia bacterium]